MRRKGGLKLDTPMSIFSLGDVARLSRHWVYRENARKLEGGSRQFFRLFNSLRKAADRFRIDRSVGTLVSTGYTGRTAENRPSACCDCLRFLHVASEGGWQIPHRTYKRALSLPNSGVSRQLEIANGSTNWSHVPPCGMPETLTSFGRSFGLARPMLPLASRRTGTTDTTRSTP